MYNIISILLRMPTSFSVKLLRKVHSMNTKYLSDTIRLQIVVFRDTQRQ